MSSNVTKSIAVTTTLPSKTRIWEFFDLPSVCVGTFGLQVLDSHSVTYSTSLIIVSGVHENTLRYFDSETGRYINRDPIGEAGGATLYGMCGNNSVNRWDELGTTYDAGNIIFLYPSTGKANKNNLMAVRNAVREILGYFDIKVNIGYLQVPDAYVIKEFHTAVLVSWTWTTKYPMKDLSPPGISSGLDTMRESLRYLRDSMSLEKSVLFADKLPTYTWGFTEPHGGPAVVSLEMAGISRLLARVVVHELLTHVWGQRKHYLAAGWDIAPSWTYDKGWEESETLTMGGDPNRYVGSDGNEEISCAVMDWLVKKGANPDVSHVKGAHKH